MSFQKGYTPWNKKYFSTPKLIDCACGCGEQIPERNAQNRPLKFANYHGNKGRKLPGLKHDKQFKKGQEAWNKGMKGVRYGGHKGLRGKNNPNWRGGFVMRNGYQQVWV